MTDGPPFSVVVTDGPFSVVVMFGVFAVGLVLLNEEVKCAPGPVSWLGSGAFKGSSRYFAAWEDVRTMVNILAARKIKVECLLYDGTGWVNSPNSCPRVTPY